ncbi:MAG TPA: hypothetical protein VJH67_00800 [Candidatus Paceibacterota bacterium]
MKKIFISLSLLLPLFASAQLTQTTGIVRQGSTLVNLLIPIVFALALLFFFWGLAQYILASGDASKLEEGRNKMVWGVVALFVMASVWGLVRFIQTEFKITDNSAIPVPGFGSGGQ